MSRLLDASLLPARRSALLLLGPSGAGKSPLGDTLEAGGLWGHRCFHFDFGATLRRAAEGGNETLSGTELAVIRDSLSGGALLENEHFPIARKLFEAFVAERAIGADDWIVLNGLPRHVGQAADVDGMVRIARVVYLDCSDEVVMDRIARNAGGDRTGRIDDTLDAVHRKLRLYEARTLPLVEHYRRKGVRILNVDVRVRTQPETIVSQLGLHEGG